MLTTILTHVLALMIGGSLGAVMMAIFCAGSKADQAEQSAGAGRG